MTFVLDPRLDADTVPVAELALSTVRLMRDARYPWLVLVPRQPDLVEVTDLALADRHRLIDEIASAGVALKAETGCLKLNVGALGNIVRQLHVHVVARDEGDAAWPGPVWGRHPPVAYDAAAQADLIDRLAKRLATA